MFPGSSVIEKFKIELRDYSISKGTIHFPLANALPLALIKKIVKARITEAHR